MNEMTPITLNLQAPNVNVIVHAKEGDRAGRYMNARLVDGATAFIPPQNAYFAVRYMKADGNGGLYDTMEDNVTPAVTLSGNIATIGIAEQALTVPGRVAMELNIYDHTGKRISAFTFTMIVEETVMPDGNVESTEYFNILTHEIALALQASDVVQAVVDMTVEGEKLPAGSTPTVEKDYDPEAGTLKLTFGLVTGDDGKSAYQSAVDGGYAGTEAQFNVELAGLNAAATAAQAAAAAAAQSKADVQALAETISGSVGIDDDYTGEDTTWSSSKINNENEKIKELNSYNLFNTPYQNFTNYNGVSGTFDGKKYILSGTSIAALNQNVYASTIKLVDGLSNGDLFEIELHSSNVNALCQLFWAVNGSYEFSANVEGKFYSKVPNNAEGMLIRLRIESGKTFNNDTWYFTITKAPSNKEINDVIPILNTTIYSNNDTFIERMLQKYKIVRLGAGVYECDNTINMPDNSTIEGCRETVIKMASGKSGIKVGANCCIRNISIISEDGHTQTAGSASGIVIEGNYEEPPLIHNTVIENVHIRGFNRAGIYGHKTGYWVADSASISNCEIYNCYAGILFEDFCEFNRVVNCLCYSCYIGFLNKSGNNYATNCSFSNNTVGIYIDCTDIESSGNNGHGGVVGCTINHSNNNNGYAIIVKKNETNGFLFADCNIWYGKIDVEENSKGIMICNTIFGGGTPEIINWGSVLMLNSCIFKVTPTFKGNGTTKKHNCSLFDGEDV